MKRLPLPPMHHQRRRSNHSHPTPPRCSAGTPPLLSHSLSQFTPTHLLNPMLMSFLGWSGRCQYWHSAAGLGSTTPAVYTACRVESVAEGVYSPPASQAQRPQDSITHTLCTLGQINFDPSGPALSGLACQMPVRLTRRVISLISTGASRLCRSFLCTHRKLISTTCGAPPQCKAAWRSEAQHCPAHPSTAQRSSPSSR